jgi:predicted transcriptional regulator
MSKKLIEIASEIVHTQVSLTRMTAADISLSLRQVFSTLYELQRAESGEVELPQTQESAPAQALTPENSIRNDKVICLECGAEFKQLTQKHLSSHGMSPKEYKSKYGFTMKTPLLAKSLAKARSRAAKKRGLPDKLIKYLEARKQGKAAAFTQTATGTAGASGPRQEPAPERKSALTPQNSIQDDKVICLECGKEMRQLTIKHLVSHGMNQKEYRTKYGFSMKTPLAAKSLIKARSNAAQRRGLPEKLAQAIEERRKENTESAAQTHTGNGASSEQKRTILRKKKAV